MAKHEKRDQGDDDKLSQEVRDALSAFNAEELVEDPDELKPPKKHYPAATPDSPNPI